MTMAAPYAEKVPPGFGWRDAALWSGAAALVVAAHAAVGWYAYSRAPEPFASDPPASAVMIDLAPMAVAPEAVPLDQADPVDSVASETVEETAKPLEEVQPETVEAEPVEQEVAQPVTAEAPEPAIDDVVRDDPVEQEELAEVPPDPVEVPLPEVAMAVPQPRPRPAPVKERDPVEKPVEKKPARKPPPSAAARKPAEAAPRTAAPAPAPGTSAGRSVSPARWQARVNAHLNRYKRFPAGVRTGGMAVVQFTINPSGTVTSASLARSSGDGALDSAALALVKRASPIPAPPPEIARASMRLTVPIEFSRR